MTEKMRTVTRQPSMAELMFRVFAKSLKKSSAGTLPNETLQILNVAIDPKNLADYKKVCGYSAPDQVPITYLHVLAARLQLQQLVHEDFSFPVLGLVHIDNEIIKLKPISAKQTFDMQCRFAPLEEHRKGKLITLLVDVFADGELVWQEKTRTLCRMPNPDFKQTKGRVGLSAGRRPLSNTAEPWPLAASLGRRYASVSGDRNPIHLWKLTAKLLGFKQQIVHGMWTKARVCAAIEPRLGDVPVRVVTEFKKPIFLPNKVHFYSREDVAGFTVEVWDKQASRPHLVGRFERL